MSDLRNRKNLELLAKKVIDGTASDAERIFLQEYFQAFDKKSGIDSFLPEQEIVQIREQILGRIENTLFNQAEVVSPRSTSNIRFMFPAVKWAAACLLLIACGIYFFAPHQKQDFAGLKPARLLKNDIAPGGYQATLKLENNKLIELEEVANGDVAKSGLSIIRKNKNGQVIYLPMASADAANNVETLNSITTDKGGEYQVMLSDGTKVWLNAASSIRFPTVFSKTVRRVQLTGEAYFEVAKNPKRPFIVCTSAAEVRVVGTHFNVQAYQGDQTLKTTLLEGLVEITGITRPGKMSRMLKPGQQAAILDMGSKITVKPVDVSEAIAWKNETFMFNDTPVKEIFKQASRWYNMEVVYEGDVKNVTFDGTIPRSATAVQFLKIISFTGLHYKLDGRKLTITP